MNKKMIWYITPKTQSHKWYSISPKNFSDANLSIFADEIILSEYNYELYCEKILIALISRNDNQFHYLRIGEKDE